MEETENKLIIWFEAGNCDILGVEENKFIDILTHGFEEDFFKCIIRIEKDLYLTELEKWLKGKSEYCDRYGHYCGVMGSVTVLKSQLIGTLKVYPRYSNISVLTCFIPL